MRDGILTLLDTGGIGSAITKGKKLAKDLIAEIFDKNPKSSPNTAIGEAALKADAIIFKL